MTDRGKSLVQSFLDEIDQCPEGPTVQEQMKANFIMAVYPVFPYPAISGDMLEILRGTALQLRRDDSLIAEYVEALIATIEGEQG